MIYNFCNLSMYDISCSLENILSKECKSVIFEVFNPDLAIGSYAGERIKIENDRYVYHGMKSWTNLAELLHCRMLIPKPITKYTVEISFVPLDKNRSFHDVKHTNSKEKYGTNSIFAKIQKLEEPNFLLPYMHALRCVHIESRINILNLGINTGDEFLAIKNIVNNDIFSGMKLTGVDYSNSAIKRAKEVFGDNVSLHCHDINHLDKLEIDKQDLIISVGTLQSPNIETKPLIMSLVQNYLTENGAMILVFPNARWIDAELIYGAKAPNYPYSELSLVIKDIYWIKKYLQQHKFRVTITGREYLFVTATKIGFSKREELVSTHKSV